MIRAKQIYIPTSEYSLGDPSGPNTEVVFLKPSAHYIEVVEMPFANNKELVKVYINHVDTLFGKKVKCPESGMYSVPVKMLEDDCRLDVALTLKLGKWYMEHERKHV